MSECENFLSWLSLTGFSHKHSVVYVNSIEKMKNVGISDNDLLYGDVSNVAEDYVAKSEGHYTPKTRAMFRYIIRKYRQFKGVEA